MANKKYKLSEDYWETSGVYDIGQSKTQRQINSDVKDALLPIQFVEFGTSSTLTSQIDALQSTGVFSGKATSTLPGLPTATSGIVEVIAYSANYKRAFFYPNSPVDTVYLLTKSGGTWGSTWATMPKSSDITTITGDISTLNGKPAIAKLSVIESASNKTSHDINIPNDSLHFLVIAATSYNIHAYGIVSTTSAGAVQSSTMQKSSGITLTTATGKITVDVGSTARPLVVWDFVIRGSTFCTLS